MIGLSGVEGVSIMTPLLNLIFQLPVNMAVGTDLLFVSITKFFGVLSYQNNKKINWNIVKLLSLGSLPFSLLTIFYLKYYLTLNILTVILGGVLGILVTISSIRAGVIGTTIILLLYPDIPNEELVGTDIAYALPLTLIAAFGHIWLGNINYNLLIILLIGSVPCIIFGVWLSNYFSSKYIKLLLILILSILMVKILLSL